MSDIGPGDFVEAVDNEDDVDLGRLEQGQVFCVDEVGTGDECEVCGSTAWLELVGRTRHPDFSWCVCAFRPIYRPKSEIIEGLKAPAPELEPA